MTGPAILIAAQERLDELPKPQDLYLIADWMELRCFLAPDAFFTASPLADLWQQTAELGGQPMSTSTTSLTATAIAATAVGPEEAVLDAVAEPSGPQEADGGLESQGDAEAQSDDPDDLLAGDDQDEVEDDLEVAKQDDVVGHLLSRHDVLRDAYPFEIDLEAQGIGLLASLDDRHRLYLALLLASCLAYVPGRKDALTKGFEQLGKDILEAYLGGGAKVEIFGTSTVAGDMFHGALSTAVEILGEKLRMTVKGSADEIGTSGDHGLDLVAWWPLEDADPASTCAVLWAQSGCGKDWPEKQMSATPDMWVNVLDVDVEVLTALLIPYWFRKPSGDWYNRVKIGKNIVFDRRRILWVLRHASLPLASLPADILDGVQGAASA